MPTESYGPFRGGRIDTGGNTKCPCRKGNNHTLGEAAKCDWRRKPVEVRNRIIAEAAAKARAAMQEVA